MGAGVCNDYRMSSRYGFDVGKGVGRHQENSYKGLAALMERHFGYMAFGIWNKGGIWHHRHHELSSFTQNGLGVFSWACKRVAQQCYHLME